MADTLSGVEMLRLGRVTAINLPIAFSRNLLETNQRVRVLCRKCVAVGEVAVGVEIGLVVTVTDLTVRKTLTIKEDNLNGREAVHETKFLLVV